VGSFEISNTETIIIKIAILAIAAQ
jgi:hypothetical protein